MKADKKTKGKKEDEKAKAEAELADTTQSYDDTEAQMEADKEFFEATEEACLKKHEEWTLRSELRDEELAGIKEALKILTSDDARALFAKTIKAGKETGVDESQNSGVDISFLQFKRASSPTARAYAALKAQATQ